METIGSYLATRLEELSIERYFAIPGDYNLVLLDEVLKNTHLQPINCCNELNAGYAADGYSRIKGVSALFVTYSVGGLSAINAVAGAYAENQPVIVISGGPNTNSIQDAEILHHTLANEDHLFVRDMFARVTAHTALIRKPEHAPMQIDNAIAIALEQQKPVYIEIACNIANHKTSKPTKRAFNTQKQSDSSSLKAAVEHAAKHLNAATKPCLIVGSKTRACKAFQAVEHIATASQYAVAAMPDAKGFFSEQHPHYMGIYWGQVSSVGCSEIVDSADAYLLVGPNENDYTTVGHMWGIMPEKSVSIAEGRVVVGDQVYTNVLMKDFLLLLAETLQPNDAAFKAFQRISDSRTYYRPSEDMHAPIRTHYLFHQIQEMLSEDKGVLVETGDSWFNGMELRLPQGCPFEIQMQYGSIGWSVGALLGMQAALHEKKRVIACIGDGSFQMGAQEVSTLIRYGLKPIIFLMNNGSYTIEVQIHDGPYNVINNWRYAALVNVFRGEQSGAKAFVVKTNEELVKAIEEAEQTDALCFIEVWLDKDDCNKHLLEWGARVANYNSRPPRS